jgi:hypothetical protein
MTTAVHRPAAAWAEPYVEQKCVNPPVQAITLRPIC